jgi:hypothetical protein
MLGKDEPVLVLWRGFLTCIRLGVVVLAST